MSRIHECRHDTPLTSEYVKLPTSAECEEPDCIWQRYAPDGSTEALLSVRSLATHHAKALRHRVVIHLAQEVHLAPKEGEPMATGAASSLGHPRDVNVLAAAIVAEATGGD
jgi:hypothetical protein